MYQINEAAITVRAGKAVTICLSVSLALLLPRPAGADAVTDWNANAGNAALAACIAPGDDPLHESAFCLNYHPLEPRAYVMWEAQSL